jgi:hypothetical protein
MKLRVVFSTEFAEGTEKRKRENPRGDDCEERDAE